MRADHNEKSLSLESKLVLIAEDDGPIRMLLTSLLREEMGLRVLVAGDGVEALRIAREERPAAVLLDALMPRMDGVEVASRLRADPATRGIVLIGISASEKQEELAAAGCEEFLSKPFDMDEVVRTVRRALREV